MSTQYLEPQQVPGLGEAMADASAAKQAAEEAVSQVSGAVEKADKALSIANEYGDKIDHAVETAESVKDDAVEAKEAALAAEQKTEEIQAEVDALNAASDVKDVVRNHAELDDYNKSSLTDNDVIKVLKDEDVEDTTTYYRYNKGSNVFDLIGSVGPYYTKAEADEMVNSQIGESPLWIVGDHGNDVTPSTSAGSVLTFNTDTENVLYHMMFINRENGKRAYYTNSSWKFPNATPERPGAMSAKDKANLDKLVEGGGGGGGDVNPETLDKVKFSLGTQLFASYSPELVFNEDEDGEIFTGECYKLTSMYAYGDFPEGTVFKPDSYTTQSYPEFADFEVTYNGGDRSSIDSYTWTAIPVNPKYSYIFMDALYSTTGSYSIYSSISSTQFDEREYYKPAGYFVKIDSTDPLMVSLRKGADTITTVEANVYDFVRLKGSYKHQVIGMTKKWIETDINLTYDMYMNYTHRYTGGSKTDEYRDGSFEHPFYSYKDVHDFINANKDIIDMFGSKLYLSGVGGYGATLYETFEGVGSSTVQNYVVSASTYLDGSSSSMQNPSIWPARGGVIGLPSSGFPSGVNCLTVYGGDGPLGQFQPSMTSYNLRISGVTNMNISASGSGVAGNLFILGNKVKGYNYNKHSRSVYVTGEPVESTTDSRYGPYTAILPDGSTFNEHYYDYTYSVSLNSSDRDATLKVVVPMKMTSNIFYNAYTIDFTPIDMPGSFGSVGYSGYTPSEVLVYSSGQDAQYPAGPATFKFPDTAEVIVKVRPELYDNNFVKVVGAKAVLKRWDY